MNNPNPNPIPNPRGESFWVLLVIAFFLLGRMTANTESLENKQTVSAQINPSPSVQPTSFPAQAAGLASADNVPPVTAQDHLRGEKQAQITLIEYSDFECPYCKRFHPTMKKILEDYSGNVNWVYRHFPLPFHANAAPAALGSECANELGGNTKFWQFADGVFADSSPLSAEAIPAIAAKIGLEKNQFAACLESKKYQKAVDDQLAGGQKAGINGTPGTILINNKTGKTQLISGALPAEDLKKIIDAALTE